LKESNNFDRVASVYNASRGYPPEVGRQISRALADLAGRQQLPALEIGAGTGLFTQYAVDLFQPYVAIDIAPAMLAQLRDVIGPRAVALVGNVTQLPFVDATFEFVLSAKVLRHVGEWRKGLQQVRRVLKEGGVFLHSEEAWLEKTEASEVRPKWEAILAQLGYAPHPHPGPTSDDVIMKELSDSGWANVRRIVLAKWQAESSPMSVLNHLEKGAGSSVFGIPEAVLDDSLVRLREWVRTRWSDPEAKELKAKAVVAVVATAA